MMEFVSCRYSHGEDKLKYFRKSIIHAVKNTDLYSFETVLGGFAYRDTELEALEDVRDRKASITFLSPFAKETEQKTGYAQEIYNAGIKNKKYLYFIEREPAQQYLTEYQFVHQTFLKKLLFQKAGTFFEDFKSKQLIPLLKIMKKDCIERDYRMLARLGNIEQDINNFFTKNRIKLPKTKKYTIFLGALHNLDRLAYVDRYNFKIFIPKSINKFHQDLLSSNIILSKTTMPNKMFLEGLSELYTSLLDETYNLIGQPLSGSEIFVKLSKIYFNKEIENLNNIAGNEVKFGNFENIMQSSALASKNYLAITKKLEDVVRTIVERIGGEKRKAVVTRELNQIKKEFFQKRG